MNLAELPLTKIFWTVFTVEASLIGIMLLMLIYSMASASGPDGGLVGAWIVLIPGAVLALVASVFVTATAPWARITCILFLLLPVIGPFVTAPIHLGLQSLQEQTREWGRRGAYIFPKAGQRKLAAAIADRDLEKIKASLPGAGDLNQQFREQFPFQQPSEDYETFLSFALKDADDSDASVQVIQLLLAAGANPNAPRSAPLGRAVYRGDRLVEILIQAGADVNAVDGSGRPVWWSVLERETVGSPDVKGLLLMLSHGADTTKRRSSGWGPIQLAAEHELWPAVLLLVERTPGGKDEVLSADGETVHARLVRHVGLLRRNGEPIPEHMTMVLAKLDAMTK